MCQNVLNLWAFEMCVWDRDMTTALLYFYVGQNRNMNKINFVFSNQLWGLCRVFDIEHFFGRWFQFALVPKKPLSFFKRIKRDNFNLLEILSGENVKADRFTNISVCFFGRRLELLVAVNRFINSCPKIRRKLTEKHNLK